MDAPAIIAAIVVVVVLVVVARVLTPWRPDGRETTTSTIASMISHGIGSAQVSPPKVSRTPAKPVPTFRLVFRTGEDREESHVEERDGQGGAG